MRTGKLKESFPTLDNRDRNEENINILFQRKNSTISLQQKKRS